MIWTYIIGGVIVAGVIALIPVGYVLAKIYPYSYPNARIRAMKAKLIQEEEFTNLLTRPYKDIIYYLEQKHYPFITAYTGATYDYASLESALRTHMVETIEKVRRISPQQTREFVDALLAKYDIQVIEAIIRGISAKTNKKNDILHQTKLFREEFVTREQYSLNDLQYELKNTPYEQFIKTYRSQLEKQQYAAFEEALDKYYFAKLLQKASSPYAKKYVQKLIDAHNVALYNKGKEPDIPGGKIGSYDKKEDYVKAGYEVAENPQEQEKLMYKEIKRYAIDLFRKEPLSEASIIGYIALKTINVRNTFILLKLTYHNKKNIEEELIV